MWVTLTGEEPEHFAREGRTFARTPEPASVRAETQPAKALGIPAPPPKSRREFCTLSASHSLHMRDQSVWHFLPLHSSMLALLLALLSPAAVGGCSEGEVNRQLILAKVKAHFLEFLGPAPQGNGVQAGQRALHRRHASTAHSWEEKDPSEVIIFPSTGKRTPCQGGGGLLPEGWRGDTA